MLFTVCYFAETMTNIFTEYFLPTREINKILSTEMQHLEGSSMPVLYTGRTVLKG